jgi:16S rRNA (cytosine1402-N4)-methyltransferase
MIVDKKLDHIPVMLKEVLLELAPSHGRIYLDCTFGAGGYTSALLEAGAEVVGIDRDIVAKRYAVGIAEKFDKQFHFLNIPFSKILDQKLDILFDGIVMDLGVSSMQIDNPERGFSFMKDGPLDMRMGCNANSAEEFVNHASEAELARVIYEYGDEPSSRKIARHIVQYRTLNPITTTSQLADVVRNAIGYRKSKIDLATKTFQAIRIHVNNEILELEIFLENVDKLLKVNGKLVVVSFHSLEDGIVKSYLQRNSSKKVAMSKYAALAPNYKGNEDLGIYKITHKKPLEPTKDEVKANIRSRSAKLRSAIKINNRGL